MGDPSRAAKWGAILSTWWVTPAARPATARTSPATVSPHGAVRALGAPRFPLGIFENQEFQSERTEFQPGDLFVVLSDGLTEVFDDQQREIGLDGIQRIIEVTRGLPLERIFDAVIAATARHGKPTERSDPAPGAGPVSASPAPGNR